MDFKFVNNLFLGRQELDFFQDSIKSEGYVKVLQQLIKDFGIIKLEESDPSFDYLRVFQGTSVSTISIKAGLAMDKNIDLIHVKNDLIDELTVPGDSITRYIIIKYAQELREVGTLDVDVNGVLTGTGTLFTEKLRGLPDFPAKISFPNSVSNTGEYTIQSITDDLTAQLNIAAGPMVAETGLEYQIVGTFTPGIPIPIGDKFPFKNDGYDIRIDVSPTLIAGEEFMLAEVVSNGVTTTITDTRLNAIVQINPPEALAPSQTNPLIGVEFVQHHNVFHNNDTNRIKVGWGFKSAALNWTYNVGLNQITITTGSGGIWSDTTSHSPGDFDGWNVYFKQTGEKARIVQSSNSGSNIVLQLAPIGGIPTSSAIVVVPRATQVEVSGTNSSLPNASSVFQFDAALGEGIVDMQAHSGSVTLQYRHINLDKSTPLTNINDGNYLNESSFDNVGNQVATVTSAVTAATLNLQDFTDNFYQSKAWLNKTNLFTATQQWARGTDITYSGTNNRLILDFTGNTFRVTINSTNPCAWINDFGEGTFLILHLIAGISSTMRFDQFSGPFSISGAARINCELDPGQNYAEYNAGDTLFFVKVSTPSVFPNRWRLVGAQSSANAKKKIEAITNPWINVDVQSGLNVAQNTSANGLGADTLLNGSLGTQAPQPGSYLRYKVIGKTVHVAFYITDFIITQAVVANVASIIIRDSIPTPSNLVIASCHVSCHSHNNVMTGIHRVLIYAGEDDIIMSTEGLEPGNASWNRTYTFNPTPDIGIQGTAAQTFNPRYSVGGNFTYEIS